MRAWITATFDRIYWSSSKSMSTPNGRPTMGARIDASLQPLWVSALKWAMQAQNAGLTEGHPSSGKPETTPHAGCFTQVRSIWPDSVTVEGPRNVGARLLVAVATSKGTFTCARAPGSILKTPSP